MEWRLVVLLVFLTALGSIFGLTTYKKYFDAKNQITLSNSWLKEQKDILAKAEEAKHHPTEEIATTAVTFASEEEKHGHEIFNKVGKCFTCHGKEGQGLKSQLAPRLAGQFNWYIYDQLVAFKAKARINQKMDAFIKNLNEQDFKDVALYLSNLK